MSGPRNPQQERALSAFSRWFKTGKKEKPVFRLFGWAGTGKTTLAKTIAEGVEGEVVYLAPTGKAAHVLHSKGCLGASTIHSKIYLPKSKSAEHLKKLIAEHHLLSRQPSASAAKLKELERMIGEEQKNVKRPSFSLNLESSIKRAALIICDEGSMVDDAMGEDLSSFGVPILGLGDPGQLPPVKGRSFFTSHTPDFFLTEIERQARDNPIIEMSRKVREGERLQLGTYGESIVTSIDKFERDWVFDSDQILVGKNDTRRWYNHRIRELMGRPSQMPVEGDKLICLKNNAENMLLNGSIWNVVRSLEDPESPEQVALELLGEEGSRVHTCAHSCVFRGEEVDWFDRQLADELDYGYAITVHKSQGSQFNKVLLIDEWRASHRKEWLYTGITRSAEKIIVVQS